MAELTIRSDEQCDYDAVSLGEVMLRLDPGDVPTRKSRTFKAWHGGGELNVAEGLSYSFGMRTSVVTALVDDGVGRNIEAQLREAGVDTSHIVWLNFDGIGMVCNGINFTWSGKGLLPSVTEYYRAHTSARQLKGGDVDWSGLFSHRGVRWFHTGGIYTLISDTAPEVAKEAVMAAREAGTFVSFDLNYRSSLQPDQKKAQSINRELVQYVDFLVGNEEDFQAALGYEIEEVGQDYTSLKIEAYEKMVVRVAEDFPNLKLIGTTLRGAISADAINWGAILYSVSGRKLYQATQRDGVQIKDRTGGGDSFVSGTAAALLGGKGLKEAVEWGAAHGALVQLTPGDTTMVTQTEIEKEIARAQKGGGVRARR